MNAACIWRGPPYTEMHQFQSLLPLQSNRNDGFNTHKHWMLLFCWRQLMNQTEGPTGKITAFKFAHLIYSLQNSTETVYEINTHSWRNITVLILHFQSYTPSVDRKHIWKYSSPWRFQCSLLLSQHKLPETNIRDGHLFGAVPQPVCKHDETNCGRLPKAWAPRLR